MIGRIFKVLLIAFCIMSFAILGMAFAQAKKVGGGDIKYESKQGKVTFSHEFHQDTAKLKCTDCHTKIFKMKKEAKLSHAAFKESKFCGTCHQQGKKSFSTEVEANCSRCHKK